MYSLYLPMEKKDYINAQKNCANYCSGYICSGIMIGEHLQQWVDLDLANKICRLKEGKTCEYYDKIVKPIS